MNLFASISARAARLRIAALGRSVAIENSPARSFTSLSASRGATRRRRRLHCVDADARVSRASRRGTAMGFRSSAPSAELGARRRLLGRIRKTT
jgi:hypothetical protein